MIKDHDIFSLVIILFILIISSLDNVWTLLGENCRRSVLALKGLYEKKGDPFALPGPTGLVRALIVTEPTFCFSCK